MSELSALESIRASSAGVAPWRAPVRAPGRLPPAGLALPCIAAEKSYTYRRSGRAPQRADKIARWPGVFNLRRAARRPAPARHSHMADKAQTPEVTSGDEPTPAPPKRSPGHRGTDVRDAVAEMTARAHEISLEAGSKMASALKDVVNAAAGLAGFAIESTRDLVQYMVRRGQMTQDEADKLLRDAEEAHSRRKGGAAPLADV